MKTFFVSVAILLLAGCNMSDFQMKRDAEKTILAGLKDPASAQFRNVKIIEQRDGSKSVCGEVNAKNSMGGYAGFRQFSYTSSSGRASIDPASTESFNDRFASVTVQTHCAGLIGKE